MEAIQERSRNRGKRGDAARKGLGLGRGGKRRKGGRQWAGGGCWLKTQGVSLTKEEQRREPGCQCNAMLSSFILATLPGVDVNDMTILKNSAHTILLFQPNCNQLCVDYVVGESIW